MQSCIFRRASEPHNTMWTWKGGIIDNCFVFWVTQRWLNPVKRIIETLSGRATWLKPKKRMLQPSTCTLLCHISFSEEIWPSEKSKSTDPAWIQSGWAAKEIERTWKKLKMWAVTNCMCCQLTPRRREKCGSKKFDNTRNVCLVCSAKVCHMKTGAFDCGGTHADVQNTTPCKSHLINTHHWALNINRKMLSVHLCNQECSLKVNFVLS